MFICDEVRAGASSTTAAARLAALARGNSITLVSRAAWDTGINAAQAVPELAAFRLVRVQCRGPRRPGPVSALILRWEAAAGNAQPFAVLDADITLIPDGAHAVLLGLAGVYRMPPGTKPEYPAVRTTATVTARALLSRIADTLSDPAASAVRASLPAVPPGGLSCVSPHRCDHGPGNADPDLPHAGAVWRGVTGTLAPAGSRGRALTVPAWTRHGNRSRVGAAGSCLPRPRWGASPCQSAPCRLSCLSSTT
jgi:hypothetical protein